MMKDISKLTVAASLALTAATTLCAGSATAPYADSSVDARMIYTIKEDTDVVHFIRDNNDPNVITKTYILKNADPYELRTYLRKVVQTTRGDSDTNVKAVKFTDGTSVLMISAEDYRFEDTPECQGFDSIVSQLDKKGITSSSGRQVYVYAPKFGSAAALYQQVKAIGANTAVDSVEDGLLMNNLTTTDALAYDPELNLMLFKTAPFSKASILAALNEYDRPTPEVRAKITVYEIYAENDEKMGLDFQAWKNNDGVDFFSGGARFMRNFNSAGDALVKGGDWSDTRYFQFNPKWNTKYIDFLASKGKAKVMHTAEMVLTNGKTSTLERKTQVFYAAATDYANPTVDFKEKYAQVNVVAGEVVGTDLHGKAITVNNAGDGVMTILEMGKDDKSPTQYTLRIKGGNFSVGGKIDNKAIAGEVAADVWGDNSVSTARGKAIETAASNEFGFSLAMTPAVAGKATTLTVAVNNSSLIGYAADGTPRIQQGADVKSTFMISNAGTKLVIGGVEKRDVVSVSGGIPLLKDLPVLGWIFSTESESTKKSQLVVVAEVIPVKAGETYTADQKAALDKINGKLDKAGESNTFGYRQFLIDSDR